MQFLKERRNKIMVRKVELVLPSVLLLVSFTGCVSMSRYKQLESENKQLESETSKVRAEKEEVTNKASAEKEKLLARIKEEELETMPVPPEVAALRGKVLVEVQELGDVHFAFDKWDLTSTAREILTKNAAWIKNNQPVEVLIEGHCDERGTVDYNLALGDRRAKNVRRYLILLGCDADRLFTISYGKEIPLDPGHNEDAWAKNRRAHSRVVYPKKAESVK
jgi:peptidoglycan-associated lipoprotein